MEWAIKVPYHTKGRSARTKGRDDSSTKKTYVHIYTSTTTEKQQYNITRQAIKSAISGYVV